MVGYVIVYLWVIFMTLGKRIKAERQKAGLSQKELAERTGTSAAMIGHYETGYRRPKYGTLSRIADALNVSYDEFLTWFDAPDARVALLEDFSASSYELDIKLRAVGWRATFEDGDLWKLSNGEEIEFLASTQELKQLDKETDSFMLYKLQELRSKKV